MPGTTLGLTRVEPACLIGRFVARHLRAVRVWARHRIALLRSGIGKTATPGEQLDDAPQPRAADPTPTPRNESGE